MAVDLKQIAEAVANAPLSHVDSVATELAGKWAEKNKRHVVAYEDKIYYTLAAVANINLKERPLAVMNAVTVALRAASRFIAAEPNLNIDPAEFAVMAYLIAKEAQDKVAVPAGDGVALNAVEHPVDPYLAVGNPAALGPAVEYHWHPVGVQIGRMAAGNHDDHANDAAQQQHRLEVEALARWARDAVRRPGDAD